MTRREAKHSVELATPRPLSLEDARRSADEWSDAWEDAKHEAAIQTRFADVAPHRLLDMWEAGGNERGKKLSRFEAEALACAIHNTFGALPPTKLVERLEVEEQLKELPPDDTNLSAKEVCRLIGVSASTLKRMVTAGAFPEPMRPTERRIAWPASDVRAFVEAMKARRTKARY